VIKNREDLQDKYLQAIECELNALPAPLPLDTLYIGGGTPTELAPPFLSQLCELLRGRTELATNYEWTVEVNPTGLQPAHIGILRAAGVNRISLGVQSFHAEKLHLLERDHDADDVRRVYSRIRENFPQISLDLICAVPGESPKEWQTDLAAAVELAPEHLSVYTLTFEKGTTYWGRQLRGELTQVDEEQQRQMLEHTWDSLSAAGWEHYEVSNFARPGCRSRHNEVYWRGDPYYAAGPGASRYVNGRRETNHRSTTTYLQRVLSGQSPVAETDELSPADRAREMLVFRLRMLEGMTRQEFFARTGFSLDTLVGRPLRKYVSCGLLQDLGDRIQLTRDGLLVSDALWPEFLAAEWGESVQPAEP
jgi:oxygen-independent coproporphyrinogen-3 oxidase